ncbi:MAG: helix-turn-helix domain-containing protein [Hyphomonas sp.]
MTSSYRQFCPVAMAAEILSKRWTLLVLRELIAGSTRFNELRRGVPRMSPTLLSARLKELEASGILRILLDSAGPGQNEYSLTESGRDLAAVIESVGVWGQRWIEADLSLDNLDPALLMWDMRRNLNTSPLPDNRSVINFIYSDLPDSQKNWWLIVEPTGSVDLCYVDPGFEVDLFVTSDLRSMTAIWLGLSTVGKAVAEGKVYLDGDQAIASHMQQWLGLSHFAGEARRVD